MTIITRIISHMLIFSLFITRFEKLITYITQLIINHQNEAITNKYNNSTKQSLRPTHKSSHHVLAVNSNELIINILTKNIIVEIIKL